VGQRERLLAKVTAQKVVKWHVLVRLMSLYGFMLESDTGSSHCFFWHKATGFRQYVGRPHPGNEVHPRMKRECLKAIEETRDREGLSSD
jgi:predicted RNA binding protein YcfA (HicA-like mRNA interferase family)